MHKAASLLLGAALAAALAAPAAADSIAYVKDGDVWLSTGDGARQFQVTTTGGYADVSQADDGTMIALHGVRLHRLDRLGNVLADFDTPVSDTRPAGSRDVLRPVRPGDLARRHQGRLHVLLHRPPVAEPDLLPARVRHARSTRAAPATRTPTARPPGTSPASTSTGLAQPGLGRRRHHDAVRPDAPAQRRRRHRRPHAEPAVGLVNGWFSDTVEDNPHLERRRHHARQGQARLRLRRERRTLTFYRVASFPTTFKDGEAAPGDRPEVCYRYTRARPAGATGRRPSRPTARGAAYGGRRRHPRRRRARTSRGGCTDGRRRRRETRLLIPGATQPDWGPADVPAVTPRAGSRSRPVATPGPTADPGRRPRAPAGSRR